MKSSPTPPELSTSIVSPTTESPAGLSDLDVVRVSAAISASHAESTRLVYAHTWAVWEHWCTGRGICPLPGDPAALCAYLVERAAEGIAVKSLDPACTTIRHVHLLRGLDNPAEHETVRQVRLGLRRIYGTAPRRLARPLSADEIGQIVAPIDRTTPIGARDAAMILLGFASAMPGAELVALTLADVETKPAGVLLTVRRSKTDQDGNGQVVAVAYGKRAATDPVSALETWRHTRGEEPGPLFTRVWPRHISLEPLAPNLVARMLRARAVVAGLDDTRVTAHSLRAGHATTAAAAGVPLSRIAAQTRHKDLSVVVNHYIRPLDALATTSSRDLGL